MYQFHFHTWPSNFSCFHFHRTKDFNYSSVVQLTEIHPIISLLDTCFIRTHVIVNKMLFFNSIFLNSSVKNRLNSSASANTWNFFRSSHQFRFFLLKLKAFQVASQFKPMYKQTNDDWWLERANRNCILPIKEIQYRPLEPRMERHEDNDPVFLNFLRFFLLTPSAADYLFKSKWKWVFPFSILRQWLTRTTIIFGLGVHSRVYCHVHHMLNDGEGEEESDAFKLRSTGGIREQNYFIKEQSEFELP